MKSIRTCFQDQLMIELQSIVRWFLSGDTGVSSETIVAHMTGCTDILRDGGSPLRPHFETMAPQDPSDLGRCLRLLERYPEWKPRMRELAAYGPDWAGVCAQWDVLGASMLAEVGIDCSKGRSAPATYRLMQLAIADGYRNDPDWDCSFAEDGTLSSAARRKTGASATS